MHGRECRLGGRSPLSSGGVQKPGDVEVGLIDPIRAWSRMSQPGAEDERHASCSGRLSNEHVFLQSIGRRAVALRPERVAA